MLRLLLVLLFIFASCSGPRSPEKRFSLPDWETPVADGVVKKIVIVSTHNLNGQLEPQTETLEYSGGKSISFKVGGSQGLLGHLQILKQRFPDEMLLLDTGHIFGPSGTAFASSSENQKALTDYFLKASYNAVLLTDRELSYMLQADWAKDLDHEKIPFVNSNIITLKTGGPAGPASEKLFSVNGLKIGVIGLTIPEAGTSPASGHTFEDPILAFLRSRQELKKQGAQIMILLAQVPNTCVGNSLSEIKVGNVANKHPLMCQSSSDPLLALLNRLPADTVDAVVVGGGAWARGMHKEIPVIQAQGQGNYLALMELFYDTTKEKVLQDLTRLYFPIKTCHQFLVSTMDCYRDEFEIDAPKREANRGSDMALMPAKFLGLEVVPVN